MGIIKEDLRIGTYFCKACKTSVVDSIESLM